MARMPVWGLGEEIKRQEKKFVYEIRYIVGNMNVKCNSEGFVELIFKFSKFQIFLLPQEIKIL